MENTDFIKEISAMNIDAGYFSGIILNDEEKRDLLVNEMVTNSNIMVYYNSYLIISEASSKNPGLFYEYWDKIIPLFDSGNSYHRNIALTIISNLTAADTGNKFEGLFDIYFSHLKHPKIETVKNCIVNSVKVMKNKAGYTDRIIEILTGFCLNTDLPEKRKIFAVSLVIDAIADVYEAIADKGRVINLLSILNENNGPKIKKQIRDLIKRYNIIF